MIDLIVENWPRWLRGGLATIQLTGLGIFFGTILSFIAGLAMLSRFRTVRVVSRTYTELFRGTSVVVQLGWFIFVLPQLQIADVSPFQGAVVALSLNIGAYGGEFVRGAIQAVPEGQTEAAIALNMRRYQRMGRIVIPQAIPGMLPPMGNLYIQLLKASAVVTAFLVTDLTRISQNLLTLTGQTTQIFTLLLVFYFVLAYAITLGVRVLERLAGRGLRVGKGAAR